MSGFIKTEWSIYKKLIIKFLTEGKRINRVPSKISMFPSIASGTQNRTYMYLKVLFWYYPRVKGSGTRARLYYAVKVCQAIYISHCGSSKFWYLHYLPFWPHCTALVSATALNTVVIQKTFECFPFVHCLNVICKAISRISFGKISMFCDCSDLLSLF